MVLCYGSPSKLREAQSPLLDWIEETIFKSNGKPWEVLSTRTILFYLHINSSLWLLFVNGLQLAKLDMEKETSWEATALVQAKDTDLI